MELTADPKKEFYVKTQIGELISEENKKRSEMTEVSMDEGTGEAGVFVICKSDLMLQKRNIYERKSNSLRCYKYHIIHCGID